MFACLFDPSTHHLDAPRSLVDIARTCSPRVCARGERMVTLDVDGLTRVWGAYRAVAEQIRRAAAEGGYPLAHVAVAATQTAAILLASLRPGITIIEAGDEPAALAPLPVRALEVLTPGRGLGLGAPFDSPCGHALTRWGIRTLGQLAALPAAQLSERLGQDGVVWQRWARGEDLEPLVPTLEAEVFEATFEPEWPIEGTEPLAFVLMQLLDPLCRRLDRRGRAAAVLHVRLRLVTREVYARSLQLPSPMRDPAVLRTLVMLALEAKSPPAGIDAVTLEIDPTPGRVVQESLLTRALPPPEQVATLMARLSALMGERRCGAPVLVDSHRPGMFAMGAFRMEQPGARDSGLGARTSNQEPETRNQEPAPRVALRRFRLPVPARVLVEHGRPVTVRTDRQNLPGGVVRMCAGPWRTSGEWWKTPAAPPSELDKLRGRAGWNRDEWDVALGDGGVYRIFEDRDSSRWFMDGILD